MRKIILASRSKARLAILKQIGLRPVVAIVDVPEGVDAPAGCAALVKCNALRKARAVAGRFKSGIVIAADTVVWVGNKVIGKPRDKRDAFKTLRLLSAKPQWVYSGLAVIDIDHNKTWIDYDKTKVYMRHLSDRQIARYIDSVGVEHLAGSFDIQGKGALFVERIKGCYYNVVGLPLAKLAPILDKIGIDCLI
jgi:septum formation protein